MNMSRRVKYKSQLYCLVTKSHYEFPCHVTLVYITHKYEKFINYAKICGKYQ